MVIRTLPVLGWSVPHVQLNAVDVDPKLFVGLIEARFQHVSLRAVMVTANQDLVAIEFLEGLWNQDPWTHGKITKEVHHVTDLDGLVPAGFHGVVHVPNLWVTLLVFEGSPTVLDDVRVVKVGI